MAIESKIFKLKKDNFREARGGYARFLHLYCTKCNQHLLLYQKDGPGPLKRLYADRIIAPEGFSKKNPPKINCSNCAEEIATAYIYEKELRRAFLINPGAIIKKLGKGIYPPRQNPPTVEP